MPFLQCKMNIHAHGAHRNTRTQSVFLASWGPSINIILDAAN